MNGENRQRTIEKSFTKLMKPVFTAMLIFLAVFIGIQAGDFVYKLDVNLVERIDSENLKKTINSAFPIIETIYNSGQKSVSLTREIKGMFAKIFDFDLDSPVTILNAQSPLFSSYYNHEYKEMLAMQDAINNTEQRTENETGKDNLQNGNGTGTGNMDEEKAGNSGKSGNQGNSGDVVNDGEGTGEDDSTGSNTADGDGSGTGKDSTGKKGGEDAAGEDAAGKNATGKNTTGSDAPGKANIPEDGGSGGNSQAEKPGETQTGQGTDTETQKNVPDVLQPISSIAYEAEDDEEDDSDLVAVDKMVVRNFTKHKIDIAGLLQQTIKFNFSKKGPKVLIYHTHTTESYILKEADLGKKSAASFNSNPKYNVVRVGEELARNLKKYGIDTLHNGTVHDKKHDAAYGASLNTLQSYIKSYPSIKVFIDIHRDALESSKPKLRVVKKINGKNAAQIMFVMGSNELLPNAHWEENLKFALKVQQKLNEKYPGLARPVWIVGKRYNQQVSNQAVLIEVGGDGNLLSECLESTKYLAEALNDVMMGK